MKKIILFITIALIIIGAIIAVLVKYKKITPPASPEQKVEQLKEEKTKNLEASGYNECMKQVKETDEQYENCVYEKLRSAGYTDRVNCIEEGNENPPCDDIDRYNAQVYADNECGEKIYTETTLTEWDCLKLLSE